jgi:hypothetical protein
MEQFELNLAQWLSQIEYEGLMALWRENKTEIHYVRQSVAAHLVFYITSDTVCEGEAEGYTIRFVGKDGTLGTLSEYKQYETLVGAIEALCAYL